MNAPIARPAFQTRPRAAAAMRLLILAASFSSGSLPDTGSTTQTLSAQVYPIGSVSVNGSISLFTSGTTFLAYSGSMTVNYRARTTTSGGGSITVRAASDFTPAGGPSIPAGALTYTCGGATLGTACSGTQTASTSSQTSVVALPAGACTGGGGACSSTDPNSVSVNFILENKPEFKTGNYSASLTFTISAT